jgi:hypothetical protein
MMASTIPTMMNDPPSNLMSVPPDRSFMGTSYPRQGLAAGTGLIATQRDRLFAVRRMIPIWPHYRASPSVPSEDGLQRPE